MPVPLLATRFFVPARPASWLSRPRLLDRLQGVLHGPVTLVSATAGFGKSSLVSDWICSRPDLRASWLSLESSDNEWPRFFRYFATAWEHLIPGVGHAARTEPDFSTSPDHEAFLNSLLNDLAAGYDPLSPRHAVIVLDDYQCVKNPAIHETIQFTAEHLPPDCHLILVTRSDPPLPLARWRSRGQLLELRTEALRFTPQESTEFLNRVSGLELTDQQVAILDSRTEGWVVGLQMAALSLSGRKDTDQFVRAFGGSHRHVLDYLVEEVLSQQTDEVQQFLLATSLLDRFCGPLCDAVLETPAPSSKGLLLELEKANLFLTALDDQRTWFRFHHLWADLLRVRLKQRAPDRIPILYRRAANWLAEHDLWQEAIHCAVQAGDFQLGASFFTQAIAASGFDFLFSGLQTLIQPFPADLVQSVPQLSLAKAVGMIESSKLAGIEPLLRAAEASLADAAASQERSELLGMVYVVQGIAASLLGDSRWILDASRQVSRLLPGHSRANINALMQLGNASFYAGDLNEIDRNWQQALDLSFANGFTTGILSGLDDLARLCCQKGQLNRADELFQSAFRFVGEDSSSWLGWVGCLQRDQSDLLRERNALVEAHRAITAGMRHMENWETVSGRALGCLHMGRILLAQGDRSGGQDMLEKAVDLCQAHTVYPDLEAMLQVFRAQLLMDAGDLDAAQRVLETALQSPYGQHEFHREWLLIALARLWTRKADPRQALALLADRPAQAWDCGRGRNWLEMTLVLALAHHALGEKNRSRELLRDALKYARPEGFVRVFVDEGEPMQILLRELGTQSQAGQPDEYAAALLRAFSPTEEMGRADQTNPGLIDPLSARELQILALVCDGLSNREIADQLVLSVGTVKSHVHRIFGKLGVRDRPQAIASATKLGLTRNRPV